MTMQRKQHNRGQKPVEVGHRGGGLYFGSPTPPEHYTNYRMGAGDFDDMDDPHARLFAHS